MGEESSRERSKARFAAIDVGSNAIRLRIVEAFAPEAPDQQLSLLAKKDDTGKGETRAPEGWREIANLRASVRLGTEVFLTGRLAPASIGQACAAMRDFRRAMDEAHVDAYRATATSAVREAKNGATLAERARREAGVELDVIEGIEEARLIELAVVRRLGLKDQTTLLVDVGGGSTEVTVLERNKHTFSSSLPLGTVRLLETILRSGGQPLDKERLRLLSEMIDRGLAEALSALKRNQFELMVGTGGNIDTLADLCPVEGGAFGHPRAIDVGAMRALFARMLKMSTGERREAFGLRPDRADTIIPAAALLLRLSEVFKMGVIVAPGVGLKEGILVELIDKHFHLWDSAQEALAVLGACERLGRRYQFDEAHGQLVSRLAGQLFDDMANVHGMGDRDRLLLRAAAMLHDVGDFVRYDGHHKHSFYIIQNSDIIGLTPDERAIVANVARYHRKSPPDPTHPNFRDLDKDARGRVRGLAAILRIADALDREHLGKVKSVRAKVDSHKGKLLLTVEGEEDRELEEWTVRAKSELLRDVFDLDVAFTDG
ncbi:MAG TPA: Ppx/GppA phosphatase family protein [Polyangiaceae bacterium]|nr:Ppx/GppA phosphatase family protein [Polyangiaceae bacterium]